MNNHYEYTIRNIVNRCGGYREREIMQAPHTVEKSETWNADHKVLEVLAVESEADGYRAGFAVDIVTRSIVG